MLAEPESAPIQISYREEGSTHKGKGSFYDHWTMRLRTGHNTTVTLPGGWNTELLSNYSRTAVLSLSFDNGAWLPIPAVQDVSDHTGHGLLLIPGRARETRNDQARLNHEQQIIKAALLRGRPILAICAGSWQLWAGLGIFGNGGGGLVEVNDHNHGSGMPRLPETGGSRITHNGLVHRIDVDPDSLLARAMLGRENYGNDMHAVPVNSVHWMAPDATHPPQLPLVNNENNVRIAAACVQDNNLAPDSRQGHQMQPTPNSVEAFELKHGAPTLGVLWHPEAFNQGDNADRMPRLHINMLRFMAFCGDAYMAKQRMLVELKQNFHQEDSSDDDNSVDEVVHGIQNIAIAP